MKLGENMFLDEHPLLDEIIQKNRINSTSALAHGMIKDELIKGNFMIIAEEQASGYGTKKNSWYSPKGGLWFTLGLYNLSLDSSITLFMSVMIHQTILEFYPSVERDLMIKWPNDIFLRGKKICGILTSYLTSMKYLICGIGIDTNVVEFPSDLADIASSLQKELGIEVNNSVFLKNFLDKVYENLTIFFENGFGYYNEYFNNYSYLKNRIVTLDTEYQKFSGRVLKVNKYGALVLELGGNIIQPFYSGSITRIDGLEKK